MLVELIGNLIIELFGVLLGGDPGTPWTWRNWMRAAVVLALLVGLVVGFVWWRNR